MVVGVRLVWWSACGRCSGRCVVGVVVGVWTVFGRRVVGVVVGV